MAVGEFCCAQARISGMHECAVQTCTFRRTDAACHPGPTRAAAVPRCSGLRAVRRGRRARPERCCTSRRSSRAAACTAGRSPPTCTTGLYQVLWLRCRRRCELALDESRDVGQGPAAIVIPPGVVHAFRFAPDTDGRVLTFDARALVEGDATGARRGAAARCSRAGPLLVPAHERGAPARAVRASWRPSQRGRRPRSPIAGWLARAVVWRAGAFARAHAARPPRAGASAGAVHALGRAGRAPLPRALAGDALCRAPGPECRAAEPHGACRDGPQRAGAACTRALVREACRRLVYIAAPVSSSPSNSASRTRPTSAASSSVTLD